MLKIKKLIRKDSSSDEESLEEEKQKGFSLIKSDSTTENLKGPSLKIES